MAGAAQVVMVAILIPAQPSDKINTGIRLTRMDLFFGGVVSFIAACDQTVILWISGRLMVDNHLTIGMFIAFNTFRRVLSH